ncbi:MAG: chorismate-binding protein [Muribaculaceae bacterium]|nr:chorismate-binding protein [Muribaculaceae bacterium]
MTQLIKNSIRSRAIHSLAAGRAFAIYRLPGKAPHYIDTCDDEIRVSVTPWLGLYADSYVIGQGAPAAVEASIPYATRKATYISRLEKLISELRRRGIAKTVISRVITGKNPSLDILGAAERLWTALPDSMGYLFYIPGMNVWLGATPEKLLTITPPDLFATEALAGTLPAGSPWNVKNYEEQTMVASFIEDVLVTAGYKFNEIGPKTVKYGNIQHLCTAFTGHIPDAADKAGHLRDVLAPTPALSGLPRELALSDIAHIESHQRLCYGGYITVKHGDAEASYVTIRCAQYDPSSGRWAIYAGGGITPKSVPESEWSETEAKASLLLSVLSN